MHNSNRRLFIVYTVAASVVLSIGLLLSLGSDAASGARNTWWLLGLAVLSWAQALLLRREISTSGRLLRLFSALSWALLGFALVSLFSSPSVRILGDLVVLLIIAATFVGPRMRRAR
jgi:hypothetical protein